jgi:hypothetical protein
MLQYVMPRNLKTSKPTLNVRQEAFAQAFAKGLRREDAYHLAGFTGHGDASSKIQKIPKVADRVAELTAMNLWGGSADLAPVINELMRLAKEAGELKTAAGMNAAKGLLSEAAKLKLQLPAQALKQRDWSDVIPPRMSEEEWIRTYAIPD